MAAVLTPVSGSVHMARTDLVNWTLVADDRGVLLIDAGFPGSRDDVMTSVERLGFAVTASLFSVTGLVFTAAIAWTWRTRLWHPGARANARR